MAFMATLRKLIHAKMKPIRKSPKNRKTAQLLMEELEERAVPTTFTVTSLADATNTFTSGTLRWAVQQADQDTDPGGATINFNIGGGGTIQLVQQLPILDDINGITINGANSGQGAITISGATANILGSSTLTANITSTTATSFTVSSASALNIALSSIGNSYTSIVQVDNEQMLVTNVNTSTNTVTVIRGYDGTTAATHTSGASVTASTPDRILFIGITPDTGPFSQTPSTNWTVENITLANGMAQGGYGQGGGGGGAGLGGAIFLNAGTLNLSNVAFVDDTAEGGGNNWDTTGQSGSSGGGGGMGGKGGSGGTSAAKYGGGGGGFGTFGSTGTQASGGREGGDGPGEFTDGTTAGNSGGLGVGKTLQPAQASGGGGSGGASQAASNAGGGGGVGAGNGQTSTGGAGGFGGGGGGGSGSTSGTISGTGGAGGYGGGGGGGNNANGGAGGFGGGDGADNNNTAYNFGGGTGGSASSANGGGGAGLGGAVFVRQGATLNILDGSFTGGSAVGGAVTGAGTAGKGIGAAIFLAGSAQYTVDSGTTTIGEDIGGGAPFTSNSSINGITGGFTKAGNGTLALTSPTGNSYAGNTTVSAGTLQVANTSNSATGPSSSSVTVDTGATLADSAAATISGAVNINGGGGITAVSGATFTLSSGLTLDADGGGTRPTAAFDLSGTPNGTSNPLINVTSSGGLVVNSGALTNIVVAGSPQPGTYDLIGYTGTAPTFANFNPTVSGPSGFTYTLVNNASGNQIDVVVAYAAPTLAMGGAPLTSYISGSAAATLDAGMTVADPSGAGLSFTGATISITSGFDSSAPDQLSWTNPDPGTMAGSYDAGTGIFTISGTDTLANYQTALESVAFFTTSTSTATRTVQVIEADTAGSSASLDYSITVQTASQLASIVVSPSPVNLNGGATQTFTAVGYDSSGDVLADQPTFVWSASAAVGTIGSSSGVLTAGQSSGSGYVTATVGTIFGQSSVTVTDNAPTVSTPAMADGSTSDVVTGTTAALSVLGADIDAGDTLSYTWTATLTPGGAPLPTYSVNGSSSANDTTATFYEAGNYTFQATITDLGGLSVTSSVNVTVVSTVSTITVSPATPNLYVGDSLQFFATANDQFGNAQPVAWSTSAGFGSISGSGLFTAPGAAATGTVYASIGSVSGSSAVTVTNPFDVTSTGDGGTEGDGSLRTAINDAQSDIHYSGPRTITFDPSIFSANAATIQLSTDTNDYTSLGASAFVISKSIIIQGPTADGSLSDDQLTIAGGGFGSDFRFATVGATGTLTLDNVTLTNFYEEGGNGGENYSGGGGGMGAGGAIFNYDGNLDLSGVTIVSCTTQGGAGSTGTSSHSTGANFGGAGGGMGTSANGAVPGGPAGIGGGGEYDGTAPFGGGGVGGSYNEGYAGFTGGFGGGGGGGAVLAGGAGGFGGGAGDTSGKGGGGGGLGGAIFNLGGTISITNSTLTDDTATGGASGGGSADAGSGLGGAIFNLNGTLTLADDTISANTTSGSSTTGTGIYTLSDGETAATSATGDSSTAAVTMNNTIAGESGAAQTDFVSNVINSGAGVTLSGSNNIVSNNSGSGFTGTNTIVADPQLGSLANYGGPTETLLPLAGSPANGAGAAIPGITTDQRGASRSGANNVPGIGADQAPDSITTQPSDQSVYAGINYVTFSAASYYGSNDSIQWQVNTGTGFVNLSDGGYYSGSATGTLAITNADLSLNGDQYRAVFTNSAGTLMSDSAALTVTVAVPMVTTNTAGLGINAPTMTITGSGFDATAANNTVAFNDGAAGTVTSATGTSLTVAFSTQPAALGSLTAVVTTDGLTSGSAVQVATVSPVVTTNTTSLAAGATTLTIEGFGFDAAAGNDTVALNDGAAGYVLSATATSLVVTLSTQPAAAGPLTAVVTVDSITSGAPVQVATVPATAPTVATNTANLPANSAGITIYGTGFDPVAGYDSVAFNDGAAGFIYAATSTSLSVQFSNRPTTAGILTAVVTADALTSGAPVQVATVTPVVSTSTASLPNTATTVTIDGYGFDPSAGDNSVQFNDGAAGTVTGATPTSLTVTLSTEPTAAGPLTAVVTTDSVTSGAPVQVATVIQTAPTVTTSTANLPADTATLTIDGTNFDPNPANDSVTLDDGAVGTVTSATATSLTVTFSTEPATAGSLTANVTVDSYSSGSPVQVATVTPVVTTSTALVEDGEANVTINGYGFDPAGNDIVAFNDGAVGIVTSATATSLTVTFTTDPTTAGSLTAVVTTDSITSGSPVQVATVTPVVTASSAGMLQHTPTLTISGYGFDPTAGNNTVTFNDGAAGTVTSATATSLTVTFSTAPTAAGSLTAVVTTDSVTSGAAVQVATVTFVNSVVVNADYAPIVDISSNGVSTVTVTTDGNNGFTAGNTVVISGYTGANAGYDGTFTVQSASGDQFTVTNTTPGLPTLSGNSAGFAISQNTSSALRGNQRSMVDSVVYTFTAPVNLTASNFTLTTSAPSVSGAPSSAPAPATLYPGMALTSLGGGSIWVVTWVSGGGTGATVTGHSLADGLYNITLGNSNEATDTFYRLYGNVIGYNSTSHTASLNNQDSLTFTHSYLLSTGAALYLADSDFDANGVINNTDSLNFTHRYLSVWSGFTPTI